MTALPPSKVNVMFKQIGLVAVLIVAQSLPAATTAPDSSECNHQNSQMEKTIFLMRRNDSRTKADFAEHYVHHHAILGKTLTKPSVLLGYTVNIVVNGSDGEPDALTEHWVTRAVDLLTPSIANATKDDFRTVLVDDQSLFSGFDLYVVSSERVLVPGKPLDSPPGERTPESKIVLMYPDASNLPPPPPGARRVIDNIVSHKLVYANVSYKQFNIPFWEKAPSDIAVFRMIWSKEPPAVGGVRSLTLDEYREIPAPDPGWHAR